MSSKRPTVHCSQFTSWLCSHPRVNAWIISFPNWLWWLFTLMYLLWNNCPSTVSNNNVSHLQGTISTTLSLMQAHFPQLETEPTHLPTVLASWINFITTKLHFYHNAALQNYKTTELHYTQHCGQHLKFLQIQLGKYTPLGNIHVHLHVGAMKPTKVLMSLSFIVKSLWHFLKFFRVL